MTPPFYDDLSACHVELWRHLAEGVSDRRSAFHTLALGTVDPTGRPQIRSVTLRGSDNVAGTLRFHCDGRSEKASEITATGVAALHGYCSASKVQIRVEGKAALHADDWIAESAWGAARATSRVAYGIAPAPGTALRAGGDYTLPDQDDAILAGRANFAAVVVTADRLEFLYLDRRGHRRALWLRSTAGWVETWLTP